MKVLVLGANGAAGQLVVNELLKLNHPVTAFVRNTAAIKMKHARLTVEQGTPTNPEEIENALAGQDAVLSTIGPRTNKKITLSVDVERNLVSGMNKHGVRIRLVWLDAAGVGSSKEFVQRSSFFFGRIIMPIFINRTYDDAALADAIIEKSDCERVIELSPPYPIRFTECDYDFNSLSFLPTAPGPKLM